MGAVFQTFVRHDDLYQGKKLCFIIFPTGLDGGFAGDGVQDLVPDGIFSLPTAGKQVGSHGFHSFGCLFGA